MSMEMERKKYRIILWGAGNTAKEALDGVSNTVEILGFCDNNPEIKEFYGLKVLDKEKLQTEEYEYDYIVICSLYHYKDIYQQLTNMGVDQEKLLINPISKASRSHIYKGSYFESKKRLLGDKKPEIFISGMSYAECGIDSEIFSNITNKETFNFALKGQDIYYDYQIAQWLAQEGFLEHVTHYIVSLCYYSFEYDYSKSVNAWEIVRYYPYIKAQHNLASACSFDVIARKAEEYFEKTGIYDVLFDNIYKYVNTYEQGELMAKYDFNKNHPITVWENKEILKEFLHFLREKQIKPVIVIMPAIKGYIDGVPEGFRERFYDALSECMEGNKIQILDYFGKWYGNMLDFRDPSHLNKNGAKKFTEKLAEDIIL